MARKPYSEDQNLHSMTTRQLRQYVYDKSREAEKRIKSVDMDEASKAFKDAASAITYKNGQVIKSTSNLSKAEMLELAYAYRQFNSLDTESKFAQSIEWKENKKQYETFIRNRIAEGDGYWEKYLTKKGNISQRGYQDYKDYINFIQSIKDYKYQFEYRTLTQYAVEAMQTGNKKDLKEIPKLLGEVFRESRGKGYSQAQLVERFDLKLQELWEREEQKAKKPKKAKIGKVTVKKTKSKSKLKVTKARKMREDGKVRERLT